jgi:hypothetical protein
MKLRSWFAPRGVEQLTQLMAINALCRQAHVEKVEAGPKGIIVAFRDNSFANPQGLVRYVAEQGPQAKVRPDMKIVFVRDFETKAARLEGTRQILRTLAALAAKAAAWPPGWMPLSDKLAAANRRKSRSLVKEALNNRHSHAI